MVHLFFLLLWLGFWVSLRMKFYRSGVAFSVILGDSKRHGLVRGKTASGYDYWVVSDDSMQLILNKAPGIYLKRV